MNLYLYGYGPPGRYQWIMLDLGVAFGGEYEPGIDLIFPDIRFIESERKALAGILLTHAHEDHFGAVIDLWPRLKAPLYATPFTAGLLKAKLASNGRDNDIPVNVIPRKSRLDIGPFDVELVDMAHSIPEPNAVVLRTPAGTVFHTGDWKLDPDPVTGPPTDGKRITEIGDEGVLAMVCDSTNAMREGMSASETQVADALATIISESPERVAVTTFASNVARLISVIRGAHAAGRHVVVVGMAMHRTLNVAREMGMLDPGIELLSEDDYGYLPRDKVLCLCTGSQGEPRGALARIASDSHPRVTFAAGDRVIFSSRTIPGNEKAVARVQNGLVDMGVEVITDEDGLVHVSGHPRRGELEQMYKWVRPRMAVPMHGEARHLAAHAALARGFGVRQVLLARNGTLIRFAPGEASVIDEAPAGRLHKDGKLLIDADAESIRARRRLAFAGAVMVSLAMTSKGELIGDPRIDFSGVPGEEEGATMLEDVAYDAAAGAFDSIPRSRRRDPGLVAEAVRRAVRAEINSVWGKKPHCVVHVHVA
ncbi:MAG: ribonuclease J [Hyphomicrobiales bacterium]